MTVKYTRGENLNLHFDSAKNEELLDVLRGIVVERKKLYRPVNIEKYRDAILPDIKKARVFLETIEKVHAVPELPFRDSSSVFICISIYDEDRDTIHRLFHAWDASSLPEGITGEVIFLVNNTEASSVAVKERNEQILRLLKNLSHDSTNMALQHHIVDASTKTHELPTDTPIGTIRNCSIAPVVSYVMNKKRNALILSSDADTFPAINLISELHSTFKKKGSLSGVVPLRFEYDDALSSEEIKEIEKILLCMDIHTTLFSFLTSGKLRYAPTHGGANTFYSCDRFLAVGGYRNSLATGEDTQLSQDIEMKFPNSSTVLQNTTMANTIRYSHRLEGDGAMFATMRNREWMVHFHARNLMYRAYLENWYYSNRERPYEEASRLIESLPENLLSKEERIQFRDTITTIEKSTQDDERYDKIFEEGLKYLYKHTHQNKLLRVMHH